jgi:hypothetical protein
MGSSLPSVVHRAFAEVGWDSLQEAGRAGEGVGSPAGRERAKADDAKIRPNAALSTHDLDDSEMDSSDGTHAHGSQHESAAASCSPSSTGSSLRKRMLNCTVEAGAESSASSKIARTGSGGASVSSVDGEVSRPPRRPRSRERGPGRAPQGRKVRPPPVLMRVHAWNTMLHARSHLKTHGPVRMDKACLPPLNNNAAMPDRARWTPRRWSRANGADAMASRASTRPCRSTRT